MKKSSAVVVGVLIAWTWAWGCAPVVPESPSEPETAMVLGLGTVIYHVSDLGRAKTWYAGAFGVQPYFDEPFYVGFDIGGYELGLDSNPGVAPPGPGGTVAYWRVDDIEAAVARFVGAGATITTPVQDVGGGIRVADLADPDGNLLGLIENPLFSLTN